MTTTHIALMVDGPGGRRPVVASVQDDTRVGDLCAALGAPSQPVTKLGQVLDPEATLTAAGICSGDTLHLGAGAPLDLRQLGPELRIVGGVGAGFRRRVDSRPLVIGRAADSDVVVLGDRVSRRHAEIRWTDDSFVVRDLDSRNGVWIDGARLAAGQPLPCAPGTPLRIGDVVVTMVGTSDPHTPRFDASLRHTIAATSPVASRRSFLPFVVPSAGAVALAATATGASAPVALAATPTALAVGLLADRGLNARAARKTTATRDALIAGERDGVRAAALTFAARERMRLPDPATLAAAVERGTATIWSTPAAELELRIGLAADVEAVAVEGDRADVDRLTDARTAHLVPRGVRIADGPIAIAGPESFLDHVLSWMVMQAVARSASHDLDLVVVSDEPTRWAWTAWLPHTTSPSVVPTSTRLVNLPSRRAARRLVVLDRAPHQQWGDSINDFVICRVDRADALPRASTVITAASAFHVNVDQRGGPSHELLADVGVDHAPLSLALGLAALQRSPSLDDLGPTITLDQLMHGIDREDQLVRNWQSSPDELEATVGLSDDDVMRIRLSGQNSHALIAGTTGSGKTRLLETMVCALAASHGPDALHLFVIDFKGGNELAGLTRLPHCAGFVSDRDPADVDRAIAALKREVAHRDELFASVGATDLVDFRAKSNRPLPRLVVIADEFGQFRRDDERGSRIATLLRIAAQGRSKGVHLVLATQTPSTDVTTDIRQNVGVRICLRVAEESESVAVLGVPDAASLPRIPGRVLIATEAGIRTGQVATSRGSRRRGDDVLRVRDLLDVATARLEVVDPDGADLFDAIVDAMNGAALLCDKHATPLLPPPLPEDVARAELFGAQRTWTTSGLVLGMRDRPGAASPPPFAFDPARDGTLTIVGGARSGRTTALVALAQAAVDQADARHPLVVHAVDWSQTERRGLADAVVDGGIVRRGDVEHLRRLIAWLRSAGLPDSARLVLVDRLDTLVRELRDIDGGALANELLDALTGGASRDVFTVATVDVAGLLAGPLVSFAGPRLLLRIDDATLATAAGLPRQALGVPGRAVAIPDGDEVQIGRPNPTTSSAAPRALGYVGPMPAAVALASLPIGNGERIALGIGGTTFLEPVIVDFDQAGPAVAVIGRARSGRSNALAAMAAAYRGAREIVRVTREGDTSWRPSASPSLVFVDNAARVGASHAWLTSPDLIDELADRGHVLVAAFDQADLNGLGFSHWLMRRPCPGLLLALDATPDRMVAGERLGFHPPAELRAGPPGRGWWCDRTGAVGLQVARVI